MDTRIQKIYTYFRQLLDDNGIDYSGANLGVWKSIIIEANKEDIKGSQVEVDFSNEGIKVKYGQHFQKMPVQTIDELIKIVSDITKIDIRKEYTDFRKLLDANKIDYSVANLGVWKSIIIEANKEDIKGSQVEVDFSNEGIKVKYGQHFQKMPVQTIDRLIETVSDITKIDIKKTEKNTNSFDEVERGARRR